VNCNESFPSQLTQHGKRSGAYSLACSSAVADEDEGWKMYMALTQPQCLGKLSSGVGEYSGYPWKVIFPLQIGIFLLSHNLSHSDRGSECL